MLIDEDVAVVAVNEWDLLPFFERYKPPQRLKMAAFLVRMVGGDDQYFDCEHEEVVFTKKDGTLGSRDRIVSGTGTLFTPMDRLRWIVRVVNEEIGRWPENGLADIRAFYCMRFTSGDGVSPNQYSDVVDLVQPPVPLRPPRAYLPAPGDEPIGDLKSLIEDGAMKLGGKR